MAELTKTECQDRSFKLGTVFRPGSPINREDLFAGRQAQTFNVVDTINQTGQHCVLYGERGVGKTSLANMIAPKLYAPGVDVLVVTVNCMTKDSFTDLWRRVFEELKFHADERSKDINEHAAKIIKLHTRPYLNEIAPDAVRRLLYNLGQDFIAVIILDEFDTIEDDTTLVMMSDTLKYLSDRTTPATIVLLGVANDVEHLVTNHRSLERCLKQVHMPRMSPDELGFILTSGYDKVAMTVEAEALRTITELSRGLPHYVHVFGLQAGRAALDTMSSVVNAAHVDKAISRGLDTTQATIQSDYIKAISSPQKEALYKEVLTACAMADTDDVGWFFSRDVREPLETILGREYGIESFSRHLHTFCKDERGAILISDGQATRPKFRFENPLMQPYVVIKGLSDGLLTKQQLGTIKDKRVPVQQELFR